MKRSEINTIMEQAIAFIESCSFKLPRFAFWTMNEWETKGPEADEIRNNRMGWDITDFGKGDFSSYGLFLFTVRNGSNDSSKNYCEKIMIVEENQMTPMHFHFDKTEDIINRGGGNLILRLYNSTPEGEFSDEEISVSMDGVVCSFKPGEEVTLEHGDSITLTPNLYHEFYAEKGKGKVRGGEISSVNDDEKDNRFYEEIGRFPEIEEDTDPLYPLCFEYPG
jgi:D-lyxose ketol-isomerase